MKHSVSLLTTVEPEPGKQHAVSLRRTCRAQPVASVFSRGIADLIDRTRCWRVSENANSMKGAVFRLSDFHGEPSHTAKEPLSSGMVPDY
ncbi:unnamed protein product [Gadus morhua 'NCC']